LIAHIILLFSYRISNYNNTVLLQYRAYVLAKRTS